MSNVAILPKRRKRFLGRLVEMPEWTRPFRAFDDPPASWTELCQGLEAAGKVRLSPKGRLWLWRIACFYIGDAVAGSSDLRVSEKKKAITSVSTQASRLLKAIGILCEQQVHITTEELAETVLHMSGTLEQLRRVCEEASASIASGGGRPPYPGFADFILRVATIYHFAGGNPSTSSSAGAKSPFVRFCEGIFDHLQIPRTVSAPRRNALLDSIRNELRRSKEGERYSEDNIVQTIASALDGEGQG